MCVFQTGVGLFCIEIEVLNPTRPVISNLALETGTGKGNIQVYLEADVRRNKRNM